MSKRWWTVALLALVASSAFAQEFWAQTTFVRGEVVATPATGGAAETLTLGTVLHRGDRVAAAKGTRATFLLNDGSLVVVRGPKTVALEPKAAAAAPALEKVAENLSRSLLSREGNNPMLKHLGGLRGTGRNAALAPNRTKVKGGPVELVWLPAPGISSYNVTLMGPDDSFWETKTATTSLSVPADRLKPGETYFWEVRDSSQPDAMSALGSGSFTTLDAGTATVVAKLEASVSTSLSSDDGDQKETGLFLDYQIAREHGLSLEALVRLAEMLRLRPDDPTLTRWRSELLEEMGLEADDLPRLAGS